MTRGDAKTQLASLGRDTLVASFLYLAAFFVAFRIVMPIQGFFFPEYASYASLLFLPHGVRVLSAWLMGWRSSIALFPGVFLAYAQVAGAHVWSVSRLSAVLITVTVAPMVFYILKLAGWDISPRPDRSPCWPCVMFAGVLASIVGAFLINLVLGNGPVDYFAYLIGDVFGLFFLMLVMMFTFRSLGSR